MARFYPVYARRSDGKAEISTKGKKFKELNRPTDEQLDQKPDKNGVADYYREVLPDDPKHIDWRRKLGGMLARELSATDPKARGSWSVHTCMLVAFPENYRLYEHIKKVEKDGKTEIKSKTHAAGGNERQDAYLYGHPAGKRKRYRSPGDFFPHLLWLCTDESGDPDNCSCKLCSPEDLEAILPGSQKEKVKQSTPQQTPTAQVVIPRPPSAQQQKPISALPPARSAEQNIDRQYDAFMYRPGELVWFEKGHAWGLGAITHRWTPGPNQYHYRVQPLSHPFGHPPPAEKSRLGELRPWLAWSVPRFTNEMFNDMADPPTYETADWHGMSQRLYGGSGDLNVDGSILAAKAVDSSYSPLNPIKTMEAESNVATYYEGLYLGAEKVWIGDPLRLSIGSGTDVLIVHSIVEQKQKSAAVPQAIHLTGDIYRLEQISHSNPNLPTPASANNNAQLPIRLTEDLAFRNARSIQTKQTASYWKLLSPQVRVDLNEVKGRWYEASLLLPILNPPLFEQASKNGEIQEATLWMNSRGDCINANRPTNQTNIPRQNVRQATRREAFGRSIPAGIQIQEIDGEPARDGVDPALSGLSSNPRPAQYDLQTSGAERQNMHIDPRFDGSNDLRTDSSEMRFSHSETHPMPVGEANFDDFMDLSEMENPQEGQGSEFPNNYADQSGNGFY